MYILIALAILPVFLLLKYINGKDLEKEPKPLLKKLFIWGIISLIPAGIVEIFLSSSFPTEASTDFITVVFNTFISVGLVEEIFKFLPVYLITKNNPEFDHRYDAIVYCVFCTLGFAVVENILYVLDSGLGGAIIRALFAVPSHACDAIIIGYFYGFYREYKLKGDNNKAVLYMILGLFLAALEHALYDGIIFITVNSIESGAENFTYLGLGILMVVVTYIICIVLLKKVSSIKTNFDNSVVGQVTVQPSVQLTPVSQDISVPSGIRYCINCGAPIEGNFCKYCGTKKV